MSAAVVQRHQVIEWCVGFRTMPGESFSGDLHVVSCWNGGALVAVIDGLGHGKHAADAARQAAAVLESRAREPLVDLVQLCHRAIRETRGVVMTLVAFDSREQSATALGIGNVEARIFRADPQAGPRSESVLLRAGIVGYQLPALQETAFPISPGDLIVFATDGVREDFCELVRPGDPLPQVVDSIIDQKLRGTDDALVLACNYTGGS